LIGRGFGASRLATELHLSVKTVETYQAHIKQKLGLHSAAGWFCRRTVVLIFAGFRAWRFVQTRSAMRVENTNVEDSFAQRDWC
jgi:hypothetical protein